MPLCYRCKSCGGEHHSPIEFPDRATFEATHLSRNTFECPKSKNLARYEKGDLYWKSDVPAPTPGVKFDPRLQIDQTTLESARLMVVDDERSTVALLEAILQRAGFRHIASATDPREALRLFDAFNPDLLLLDIQMPHLDGFGVMAAIRSRNAGPDPVPILVLSGDLDPAAKFRALAEGAKDFLAKPFEQLEALLRIKNLLETRFLQVRLKDHIEMLEGILLDRAPGGEQPNTAAARSRLTAAQPTVTHPRPSAPTTPQPAPTRVPEPVPAAVEAEPVPVRATQTVLLPSRGPNESAWVVKF